MKVLKPILISALFLLLVSLSLPFNYHFETLDPGPVRSFEKNCARCHGPQGSFYGEAFGQREREDLRYIIEEMMFGPAFLSPSPADVHAMTAYHRALSNGEPFVCITKIDTLNKTIKGEVIPGNQLFIKQDGDKLKKIAVDSSGKWETGLPIKGLLIAKNDSISIKMNPEKQQWTQKE